MAKQLTLPISLNNALIMVCWKEDRCWVAYAGDTWLLSLEATFTRHAINMATLTTQLLPAAFITSGPP
jgi:hypothetical protein